MAEPIRCSACQRAFNAQFAKCPFCSTPNGGPQSARPVAPHAAGSPTAAAGVDFAALAAKAVELAAPLMPLELHPAALVALDHLFDQTWGTAGDAPEEDAWRPSQGKWVAILHYGALLGEVIRSRLGGRWMADPGAPTAPLRASLVLPSGMKLFPVSRVFNRLKNGSSEALAALWVPVARIAGYRGTADELAGWLRYAGHFERLERFELALPFFDHALAMELDAAARQHVQSLRLRAEIGAAAARVQESSEEDGPPAQATHAPATQPPRAASVANTAPAEPTTAGGSPLRASAGAARVVALGPSTEEAEEVVRLAVDVKGLVLAGRHHDALLLLERMLELDPANVENQLGRAGELLMVSREREALEAIDDLAGRPDSEPRRSFLAALAADQLGGAEVVRAERAFRALQSHPQLSPEQRALCRERAAELTTSLPVMMANAEALPDLDDAVAAFGRLSSLFPSHAEPLLEQGVGLTLLGRPDEALGCFDRAIQLAPTEVKAYDHRAVTLLRLRRLDEALWTLDAGLRQCPTSGTLHTRRGICLSMAGRAAEALVAFEDSLRAEPAYLEAWAHKGDLESKSGQPGAAIESLRRFANGSRGRVDKLGKAVVRQLWALEHPGVTLDGPRAERCHREGQLQLQYGRLDRALAELDEAVAAEPLEGEPWSTRGSCLGRLERWSDALASFERAEALLGSVGSVVQGQVDCLVALDRFDEALEAHGRELARGPVATDSLHRKARTLVAAGRRDEALALYRRLLARSPTREQFHVERAELLASRSSIGGAAPG